MQSGAKCCYLKILLIKMSFYTSLITFFVLSVITVILTQKALKVTSFCKVLRVLPKIPNGVNRYLLSVAVLWSQLYLLKICLLIFVNHLKRHGKLMLLHTAGNSNQLIVIFEASTDLKPLLRLIYLSVLS